MVRNFNPRTREGCDRCDLCRDLSPDISTHAPAKGATVPRCYVAGAGVTISTHAPAKGATCMVHQTRFSRVYFNPRTREGCDARGMRRDLSISWNFNPRTREGCDACPRPPRASTRDFNPRTREGCDLDHPVPTRTGSISTHAPAKGATEDMREMEDYIEISTHAPAKGAT